MSPAPRRQSAASAASAEASESSKSPYDDEMSLSQPAMSDDSSDAASAETAATDPEAEGGFGVPQLTKGSSAEGRKPVYESESNKGAKAQNEDGSDGERKDGWGVDRVVEWGTDLKEEETPSGPTTAEETHEEEKKDGGSDENDADDGPSPSSAGTTPNPGYPTSTSTSTPAVSPTARHLGTKHPNSEDGTDVTDGGESRENVTRPIGSDEDNRGGKFHDAPPATDPPANDAMDANTNGGTNGEPPRDGSRTSSVTSRRQTDANTTTRQRELEAPRHETHIDVDDGQGWREEEAKGHNPASAAVAVATVVEGSDERPDPPARSSSILLEEREEDVEPAAAAVPRGCYSSAFLDEEGSRHLSVGEGEPLEDPAGGDCTRTAAKEPVPSPAAVVDTSEKAEKAAMSPTEVLTVMSPPETPAVPKTLVLSPPSPEPSEAGPAIDDDERAVEPEGSVAAVDPEPKRHDERSVDPVGSLAAPALSSVEPEGSVPGSIHDEVQTVETASTLDAPVPVPVPALLPPENVQRSISFSAAHEIMPPPPASAIMVPSTSPMLQRSIVSNVPLQQQQPIVQMPAQLQLQPQVVVQQQQPMQVQNTPSPPQQQQSMRQQGGFSLQQSFMTAASAAPPGRRKIHFRLMEEEQPRPELTMSNQRTGSTRKLFQKIRRRIRSNSIDDSSSNVSKLRGYGSSENLRTLQRQGSSADTFGTGGSKESGLIYRGTLVVSWYDGTGSAELQEHVMSSAARKLGLTGRMTLEDVRIIDDAVVPHEEIVLCPYIPDGSQFVLKFRINDNTTAMARPASPPPPPPLDVSISSRGGYVSRQDSVYSRAPESPSAAPSPFPSNVNLFQLQMLLEKAQQDARKGAQSKAAESKAILPSLDDGEPSLPPLPSRTGKGPSEEGRGAAKDNGDSKVEDSAPKSEVEAMKKEEPQQTPAATEGKKKELSPDELVLKRLNQLNELLTEGNVVHKRRRKEEKKQVVFVLANYFVLFLSLIAISAEIHTRAPLWMEWLNSHLDSVQQCSANRDALYECVSEGNFSGLVAAFVFWITRSAATKNVLLFGFESTQKLWTVVYEALVSAVCWGCSYMFIRRGLNPDTRPNFLHKYWKDAVYGSLAGFNAAFMKAVLKNLLPQDQVLDVLEGRQLRIVDWVSHIFISRDS